MIVLAIGNQKGGTGKTATTHALGAVLASAGRRVLLIDADPQGSLTGACGIGDTEGRSLAEVVGDTDDGTLALGDVVRTLGPGLDLVPADIALASSELGLVVRMGREGVLKQALTGVAATYDVAIIDCPPSLGLLTINALAAAHGVLIPTQPQIVDLRGLNLFLGTIERVRRALNPDLQIVGIVATFSDGRLVHHRRAVAAMREASLPLLDVTIGRSVRVAESAATGQSVVDFDAGNPRALEYQALGQEVSAWLAKART